MIGPNTMGEAVKVTCQQCGGMMKTATLAEKSAGKLIFAGVLILFGLIVIISTAGIGFPVYIVLFIIAAWLIKSGHKKKGIWKCPECGYYFNRMV